MPSLFTRKPVSDTALDPRHGSLVSDLWLDQPDAERQIAERHRRGRLNDRQATDLLMFSQKGYLILDLDLDDAIFPTFDALVERLWQERPAEVAFAYNGPLQPLSQADPARHRRPSYRLADLQGSCPEVHPLYLMPQIFAYLELIFEEPAVATQSLYFEYGSQQALHRDPVFVRMHPASHLVAAWIALEDIDARSGPLLYVPGSHRLPYPPHHEGRHDLGEQPKDNEEVLATAAFELAACERQGLAPTPLLARRGQALLWHASLLHGGATPEDPHRTRKSFVVHYTTRADFGVRRGTVMFRFPGPNGEMIERHRIVETDALLEHAGCVGFDNPLRHYRGQTGTA